MEICFYRLVILILPVVIMIEISVAGHPSHRHLVGWDSLMSSSSFIVPSVSQDSSYRNRLAQQGLYSSVQNIMIYLVLIQHSRKETFFINPIRNKSLNVANRHETELFLTILPLLG